MKVLKNVNVDFLQAWSSIVYMLIPNVAEVERSLGEFADIMEANEVLLFEKSTFLIIAHAQRTEHRDVHRFEKISNIIKQFKLSCIKLAAQFTVSIQPLPGELYKSSTNALFSR